MAHQIWFEGNDFSWPLVRPVCFAMRMRSLQRARRRRRRMRSLCCTREVLVANAAIRMSIGCLTTDACIDRVAEVFPALVAKARGQATAALS